jgi:competence protein ComEA
MPRPVPPDAAVEARLGALQLGRAAWVPDQPDLAPPRGEAAAQVSDRATGSAGAGGWPAWAQELRLAATPRALATLALACAACVVATAVVLLRPHGSAPPVQPSAVRPLPPAAPPAPALVVDVGGRVRHPGLVTLPAGSRVADALRAAGGALRERDLVTVDLAARVVDGQLLLVGVPGAGTAGPTGASVVDLNAATREQLEGLPGVGPVLAQHILDWRERHGGFRSVDELNDVPGIGDRTFASLKPLVAV